jgi:hypothetical protein
MIGREELLFLEKKQQKNFFNSGAGVLAAERPQGPKNFSSKKKHLA